jgi:hypothetical protein
MQVSRGILNGVDVLFDQADDSVSYLNDGNNARPKSDGFSHNLLVKHRRTIERLLSLSNQTVSIGLIGLLG